MTNRVKRTNNTKTDNTNEPIENIRDQRPTPEKKNRLKHTIPTLRPTTYPRTSKPPRGEPSLTEPDAAYLDTPRRHAQKRQSGSELFHTRRYATYLVALRVAYRFYH